MNTGREASETITSKEISKERIKSPFYMRAVLYIFTPMYHYLHLRAPNLHCNNNGIKCREDNGDLAKRHAK